LLKECPNRKIQVSPLTGLKRIPPGVGDVPQDRPGGPLCQPKPAIKNSLRKSSKNYAKALELVRALLILTVYFGYISGYHVDALPIKKHDALKNCGKLFFLQS
jgi:hypothetical protein